MRRRQCTHAAGLVLATLFAFLVGQTLASEAIPVPGGDFSIYKPGTGYTVGASLPAGTYARGVGDNLPVHGGVAEYDDGTTGTTIDCPGWVAVQGHNNLAPTGVGGSVSFNAFAAWSGGPRTRVRSAASLGQIRPGATYTITAVITGDVAAGPIAFQLLADGVPLTPSASVDPVAPVSDWQTIFRTYGPESTVGQSGKEMTIVIGVTDENDLAGRMIYDNVTLEAENLPRPATIISVQ